jgi:RNA polymerase sigma-70 factor (ECF subfamily)
MLFPTALPVASDEEQLVQRLVARDEQALRLVYEKHGKALLAVIQRMVRDKALAQDILQEGLLKVWLSIASYDASRARLFTWMVRVCSNQAIDALRSPRNHFHRSNLSLEVGSAQRMPTTSTFNPEHIGLRELTLCLKPRQREVVDLLYFGGYTQAEAAEHLSIPLATVKTRSRAALQVLAKFAKE